MPTSESGASGASTPASSGKATTKPGAKASAGKRSARSSATKRTSATAKSTSAKTSQAAKSTSAKTSQAKRTATKAGQTAERTKRNGGRAAYVRDVGGRALELPLGAVLAARARIAGAVGAWAPTDEIGGLRRHAEGGVRRVGGAVNHGRVRVESDLRKTGALVRERISSLT